ncbi:hypothetical protein RHMOL_Rhmol02G0119800 [Rhododendron molle]|uniref:Uncharacterized protein n=1 Tax=Rhododendron molle TaxID=49168 RepID=A0ACC0PNV4_RHOML|nr:hypothetical protein RHMOL_Rhmol02G0119800 [Rhododendron molle]
MGINCCKVPMTMQQPSPNGVPQQPQQMAAPPPTYNQQQQNQYLHYQQQQQWMMANQQPPPPQQQQPYQCQPQPQQMYYQQQQPPQAAAVATQPQHLAAAAAQPGGAHFTIFVGDLAPDVTDQVLQQTSSPHYPSVKGAKIVTDMMTGWAKGYGFVRLWVCQPSTLTNQLWVLFNLTENNRLEVQYYDSAIFKWVSQKPKLFLGPPREPISIAGPIEAGRLFLWPTQPRRKSKPPVGLGRRSLISVSNILNSVPILLSINLTSGSEMFIFDFRGQSANTTSQSRSLSTDVQPSVCFELVFDLHECGFSICTSVCFELVYRWLVCLPVRVRCKSDPDYNLGG